MDSVCCPDLLVCACLPSCRPGSPYLNPSSTPPQPCLQHGGCGHDHAGAHIIKVRR